LEQQSTALQERLLAAESRNALIPELEQHVESMQALLLGAEGRNALIPDLRQRVETLQERLLESESRNALIPGLEQQSTALQERLLAAESRNALIPELEQRVESMQALLLGAEGRNALIPDLQQRVETLQERLLESESRNALIPGLKQQSTALLEQLLTTESRNARISGLEQQVEALQRQLLEAKSRTEEIYSLQQQLAASRSELDSARKSVCELEMAQLDAEGRLGEIAVAEERLNLLHFDRSAAAGRDAERFHRGDPRKLRIGIFGNINNYPLMLAEGFRALGHEVRLVVNRKEALHRPESKYAEWDDSYPDWILDCSALSEEAIVSNAAPLFSRVVSYFFDNVDLVVLNDYGPALSRQLPKPQMAFLTGSDLTYYANYRSLDLRTASWDLEYKKSAQGRRAIRQYSDLVTHQRDGILAADVVSFGLRGLIQEGDNLLDSIGVADSRRMMILLSDTENLEPCPPANNIELRIFNGARVSWQQTADKRFSQQDLKGTDVLINGFAIYCSKGGQGELHMVRKGYDVDAAVELCAQLGIGERVVWLAEMDLHQYDDEVRAADVVCDQFGMSFPGMVTTHAYALGRPVLANFRNECFAAALPKPLPGFQASTSTEVAEHLLRLDSDRKAVRTMAKLSRRYAEKYISPASMAEQVLARAGIKRKD
jgi:hypothetical protein